ncbi:MAG: tetratricopeptide repeat protein [Flavobacteriales bacterium]|nr:tetratricopeptide repeat protein [Flavobacteriales bacterium]
MKKWLTFLCLLPLFCLGQNALLQQAISVQNFYPDSAIQLAEQVIEIDTSKQIRSNAFEVIGIANWVKADYSAAIEAHSKAFDIRKQIDYKDGIANSLNNLGLIYQGLGDKNTAVELYLNALEMAKSIPDSGLMGSILGNIGILYEEQGEDDKALDFHLQCLDIAIKLGIPRLMGNTWNNIALIYKQKAEYEKATPYAQKCFEIRRKYGNELGQAQALNLLGTIASKQFKYAKADSLYQAALTIYRKKENAWGEAMVLGNIGQDAAATKQYSKAKKYCQEALELSQQHQLEWEGPSCKCLGDAYIGLKDGAKAQQYWQQYFNYTDSVHRYNLENDISLLRQRFEHEKERIRIESEIAHQKELAEAELNRQRQLSNASIGIGMMALILFFVLFSNYRTKQRDNELLEKMNSEISEQKAVIEEKNEHITDSIRYAQQLQHAILPKHAAFEGRFDRHFILYRPKDIVSGDFYWLEEANGKTFVAVADCTGHGVPGAMVSMVGYQGLNKAVREKQLSRPSEILQSLSDHIEEQFEKSGGSVRDGMDIALFAISKDQKQLTFAGAHNPLLLVSKRNEINNCMLKESQDGWNVFEVKADRRSIGGFFDAGPFTDHELTLEKGDTIFMFSDGYADQFGGPNDKKLGIRKLRNILLQAVANNDLHSLESLYLEWKGPSEQIDDVSLIGLTV